MIHFSPSATPSRNAGTDLAIAQDLGRERMATSIVINGTKIFTSGANDADYIWLAARTDPEGKKHRGITIFIVDTNAAGLQCIR